MPSYSVSRQGSPLQANVELPEEGSLDTPNHDDNLLLAESTDASTDPPTSVKDAGAALIPESQMPEEDNGKSQLLFPVESTLQNIIGDVNNTTQVDNPAGLEANTLDVTVGHGGNSAQVSCKNTELTCLKMSTGIREGTTSWT